MIRLWTAVFALGLSIRIGWAQQVQEPSPRVWLVVERASPSQVCEELVKQHPVNLLAEVHLAELQVPQLRMEGVPLRTAVQKLTELYGREVMEVCGGPGIASPPVGGPT